MTRATVGGINSEDNLWYPLAVNSQGIAQIDTSGIPAPMQWKRNSFTPYYLSTDAAGSASIEYSRQDGTSYRLGEYCFVKVWLQTSAVVITNPRGLLAIGGFPYTWSNSPTLATPAGGTINKADDFANNSIPFRVYSSGANLRMTFWKLDGNQVSQMNFADLSESAEGTQNTFICSYYGIINSTETPPDFRFSNGILQETDEIPTGTP